MTFTYDPTVSTNRDKVRLLIGDTDSSKAIFSDEELCFFQTEWGTSIYSVALGAIDVAIAKYARVATSKTVGPLSLSYADRIQNLESARAAVQVLLAKGAAPTPYVGGIRVSDKEIDEEDDDMVGGFARKGGFDNPGAGDEQTFTDLTDRERG